MSDSYKVNSDVKAATQTPTATQVIKNNYTPNTTDGGSIHRSRRITKKKSRKMRKTRRKHRRHRSSGRR